MTAATSGNGADDLANLYQGADPVSLRWPDSRSYLKTVGLRGTDPFRCPLVASRRAL